MGIFTEDVTNVIKIQKMFIMEQESSVQKWTFPMYKKNAISGVEHSSKWLFRGPARGQLTDSIGLSWQFKRDTGRGLQNDSDYSFPLFSNIKHMMDSS